MTYVGSFMDLSHTLGVLHMVLVPNGKGRRLPLMAVGTRKKR